ncbi:L-histidine N(alpha)-methyltransferase [Amphiplicatus metriothermophilus]|uniref:Dimethylhistidine N-methyltransferase n=1 Tax=Amphiplicatus metriothermophilus TaxID=1519374 RepID=A0A239PK49_9PROT|nr:L-histidine N(alpha)-methyltransferase [Amphiplicatus metriothermophilus]MBB5517649.1 dimethylhistidine N-methyltransferase [Amphiplicatus metriothermophilus]SNT68017.1 dimethylhistidine N-methyltransferase [Amphiplicatus metriothermophilus]
MLKPAPRPAATPAVEFIDLAARDESFEEAFLAGMSRRDKAVPCRFLYDARGSALFDEICTLPEYYPTRTETRLLKARAGEIAAAAGPHAALVELGSGSSVKTRILLDRLDRPGAYMPVDVSRQHLRAAAARIAADYPGLRVVALCADYAAPFDLPHTEGRRIGFFPGSTIGNLSRAEAKALLGAWRVRLGPGGLMLVGVDLKKNPAMLEAAYDDAAGVTEAFIKNILARANAELRGDFDLARFDYEARWNPEAGRVEMHLVARGAQRARAGGRVFSFADGERIHVENSHKYGLEEFAALARAAGFSSKARYTDEGRLFSLHLLEA